MVKHPAEVLELEDWRLETKKVFQKSGMGSRKSQSKKNCPSENAEEVWLEYEINQMNESSSSLVTPYHTLKK